MQGAIVDKKTTAIRVTGAIQRSWPADVDLKTAQIRITVKFLRDQSASLETFEDSEIRFYPCNWRFKAPFL
jgi:hypothetical protein